MRATVRNVAASISVLILLATPATAGLPVAGAGLPSAGEQREVAPGGEQFFLGVRGRQMPADEPGTLAVENDEAGGLDWQLDAQRAADVFDAQSQQQNSKWDDLSKTTKIWLIVGGVITVGIIAAAMSD